MGGGFVSDFMFIFGDIALQMDARWGFENNAALIAFAF